MFFCSWGIWWSFFSRWLTDPAHGLGMTSAEQGQIYSINSLATLVIMFAYGAIQDQLGIKRKLVIFVSAIAALVGPFVQFVYAPMLTAGGTTRFIGVLIGSIVLSAGFMAGCSLFEALTERYSRKFGFEYGQSRAWGSFGYAIVALCAGFLFNINPLLNFWVGSICGLGMLCIYAFWVPAEQKEELKKEADPNAAPTNPSFKEMISVLKMPTLWVLIVFMLFTNTFYTVFDQQMFPNYYASLFSTTEIGNATYGTLNSFQVFLEAAGMFCAPWLVNRIGAKNGLIFAGMVMAMRMVASGLVEGPLLISITKLLHAVELPILLVAIFKYNSINFDKRLSSTLYLVGFACTSSIIASVLSPLAGYSYEKYGFAQSYLIMGLLVFCTTFISIFLLRSGKSSADPLMSQPTAI